MSNTTFVATRSKLYFPQLDSIRGLSFIAIFLFHTLHIPDSNTLEGSLLHFLYKNLDLGVEAFFVLSSYLLTWLALNEYKKRKNFSLRNYFKRRVLRIWPLYFFILIITFVVFKPISEYFNFKMTLPEIWYYLFFIANFYKIDHIFFLRFLWTISVEEQFYFIWGISLRYVHKFLIPVLLIFILMSIFFSVFSIVTHQTSYFNTITYLFDFGCGGLAAIVVSENSGICRLLQKFSSKQTILFYCYLPIHLLLFFIIFNVTSGITSEIILLISRYLIILYIAILLAEQMVNYNRSRMLEKNKFLIFTGKISYGLYCYHGITITFVNLLLLRYHIFNPFLVLIYFVINYLIATISYFYLEAPFLKLKTKLRRI